MGARVAVAGASGYAGGELLRLLTGHPGLEIGPLAANSSAGQPVTAVHPQLTGYPGLDGAVFAGTDPDVLADADLLFTALPHGESAQLAARLPDHLRIIDLGADFRLADPGAWERYYPTPYAGQWTYGLPELPGARDAIRAASRVAAPGGWPATRRTPRRLRRRTLRARAARGPVAGHRRHPRLQRRPPAGGGRPARWPRRRRLRPGQPGQGRGRPGHPDRQPHARPAGNRRPDRTRSIPLSVTAPLGFRAAGVAAGLKQSGQPDVAVVLNDGPSRSAAAVFTTNRVQAAPVTWTRQVVKGGRVRAVVLNSGGANACTGPLGFQDTHATAEHLAAAIGALSAEEAGAG